MQSKLSGFLRIRGVRCLVVVMSWILWCIRRSDRH